MSRSTCTYDPSHSCTCKYCSHTCTLAADRQAPDYTECRCCARRASAPFGPLRGIDVPNMLSAFFLRACCVSFPACVTGRGHAHRETLTNCVPAQVPMRGTFDMEGRYIPPVSTDTLREWNLVNNSFSQSKDVRKNVRQFSTENCAICLYACVRKLTTKST